MIIALGIVAVVLLSVVWLGNRNWSRLLGSAGAGCAGLCIGVLGVLVVPAGIIAYGYQLDSSFMSQPANALFWLAAVVCVGSLVMSMGLISTDNGGVR